MEDFYEEYKNLTKDFENPDDHLSSIEKMIDILRNCALAYQYFIRIIPRIDINQDLIEVLTLDQRSMKYSIKFLKSVKKLLLRRHYLDAFDDLDSLIDILVNYIPEDLDIYDPQIISSDMREPMTEFQNFIVMTCSFVNSYLSDLNDFISEKLRNYYQYEQEEVEH
jgi:hypothetical protein